MTCRSEAGVDLRIGRMSHGKTLAYRDGNHLSGATREAGFHPCRGNHAVEISNNPRTQPTHLFDRGCGIPICNSVVKCLLRRSGAVTAAL